MHSSTPQPKRLGKYEVDGTISVGSTWRLYKGFDPASQRSVVLKAIPKDLLDRSGVASRLRAEVRAASGLEHPGIVRVYGYGEDAGLFYVVMEYADGWILKERFRVPVPDAVNLSEQLLQALDYAHELNVIHGEIAPSNLLLAANGQLRIINFGVARIGDGSPNYRSPEQLKKLPVDRRSDVFSAGLIFYELLTGAHAFAGSTRDMTQRINEEKERPPSQVNSTVLATLDEVCAKALAKTVEARYQSARAFSDGIRRAFASAHDSHLSRRVSHETIIAFTSPRPQPEHVSGAIPQPKPPAKPVSPEPARPISASNVSPAAPPAPASAPRPASNVSPPVPPAPRPASNISPAPTPSPIQRTPSEPKHAPKPDIKKEPAAAQVPPQVAARIEQLLGKQPETLAAYLNDASPELDTVLPAFVSTVRAVILMYEAKDRNDALIPQIVRFDQLGKATIQSTQSGSAQATTVLSNPRYAAPEMFSEKAGTSDAATPAANVYALGVMFYEILLGRKLFEQKFPDQRNDIDWMRWHADLESKAQPLKSFLPDCPAALSDVLESMMEKHVEKRPTDLNDILTRLRSVAQRANKTVVLQRPAAPAQAPSKAPSSKRKFNWINPLLFVLLVGGIGWVGYKMWQDPEYLSQLFREITSYISRLTQKL